MNREPSYDSDAAWGSLGVAKKKSLDDYLKPTELKAKQADTNEGPSGQHSVPVDVAALQRALALAETAYIQQEKTSGPINESYARIVNDALR